MRFILTYDGKLRPSNSKDETKQPVLMNVHKHSIRRKFHNQLKELWRTNRFLREHRVASTFAPHYRPIADSGATWGADPNSLIPMHDVMATWYPLHGFHFLPLVVERFSLLCSLDVLFLRRDIPGSALTAGDIDNRIKTLIDALRMPLKPNEFVGANNLAIIPAADEEPFYVLLEEDKLVSHFSVRTETLLEPRTDEEGDASKVKLVITVELRPYDVTSFNLSFA